MSYTNGIYRLKFKCGSIYIGKSGTCELRFRQHLSEMKLGSHKNKKLQQYFDIYGEPDCKIIKEVDNYEDLPYTELYYINKYINKGYNLINKQISVNIVQIEKNRVERSKKRYNNFIEISDLTDDEIYGIVSKYGSLINALKIASYNDYLD